MKLYVCINEIIINFLEEQTQNLKIAFYIDYQEIISQINNILEDIYGRSNKDKVFESMSKFRKIAFKV